MKKKIAASIIQALGIIVVAGGVALISHWGGLVILGLGTVLFGVALERDSA